MEEDVSRIVIGMDPHKRSVTIEVMSADESVLGGGRFDTTVVGYAALLEYVAAWPSGSIEGCEGTGRHIAQRLLADGQDVPGRMWIRRATCPGCRDASSRLRSRSYSSTLRLGPEAQAGTPARW